jgi:IclR family KDG regulon transcriptional repressor
MTDRALVGAVARGLDPVASRTKPTTREKPANPGKAVGLKAASLKAASLKSASPVAKLVLPAESDIDGEAEDRQRAGVQSLGRAFAILEEVARHREGIGLAELSKLVALHNSTTFHLAKTLVSLGYLRQEKDSKRYRVGRPLFALAASALDEIEMVNVATPILEELSRQTGESSHFAVRMGDSVVVIARTSGPGAFQLTDRVGIVRPAHCTALGKIILASLRPDQLNRFLERVELKPSTGKSITDVAVLLREIAEIKRTGIAFDDGEFNPEVRCVAVPVTDFTGQVVGALGISGPIWRLSNQSLHSSAQTVKDVAGRLSAEFGAQGVRTAKGATNSA